MMLKAKQKGFTLLELLVVITLLAILSVGALVAYDGLTEKAQAAATSNNTVSVDRAIRSYRIIAQKYPEQWDNLAASGAATGHPGLAPATQAVFGDYAAGASSLTSAIFASLEAVGIEELQQVSTLAPNVVPNLQHNEGANPTGADEVDTDSVTNLTVMPSFGSAACNIGGSKYDDGDAETAQAAVTAVAADGQRLNKLNDFLETGLCHAVVALGFGHDAAHSTTESKAAIATPATYTSAKVDPSKHYARYIGLFHVGTGNSTTVVDTDILPKARFIGIVDPEGNGIDDNISEAIAN